MKRKTMLKIALVLSMSMAFASCGGGGGGGTTQSGVISINNYAEDEIIYLEKGETLKLEATVSPDATVEWAATEADAKTDSDKVTIDSSGLVTAKKVTTMGNEAIITAKAHGKISSVKIAVVAAIVKVTGLQIVQADSSTHPLYKGKPLNLTTKVTPANATDQKIEWTSSKPEFVSVTKDGLIKGEKVTSETVEITAKATHDNIECTETYKVTVQDYISVKTLEVKKGSDNISDLTVKKGDTVNLTGEALGAGGVTPTKANITWTSNHTSFVTVTASNNGKNCTLTAKQPTTALDTVTITASTEDGVEKSFNVDVKKHVPSNNFALPGAGTTMGLAQGTSKIIAHLLEPATTTDSIEWTTNPTGVVTIEKTDEGYKITPIAGQTGTVTVTATQKDVLGNEVASKDMTFDVKTAGGFTNNIASLTIKDDNGNDINSSITIAKGNKVPLSALVQPSTANPKVTWATADGNTVSVNELGIIEGKQISLSGIQITATTEGTDGSGSNVVKTITVKVENRGVTGVTLNKPHIELFTGEELDVTAAVIPDDATNKAIEWTVTPATDVDIVKSGDNNEKIKLTIKSDKESEVILKPRKITLQAKSNDNSSASKEIKITLLGKDTIVLDVPDAQKSFFEDGNDKFVNVPVLNQALTPPENFNSISAGNIEDRSEWHGVFVPNRKVKLSPFAVARTEVTNDQWKAVRDSAGSNYSFGKGSSDANDLKPVTGISWNDAIVFCNAKTAQDFAGQEVYYLNGEIIKDASKMGVDSEVVVDHTKQGFRLPTEAEWEYLARFQGKASNYAVEIGLGYYFTQIDAVSGGAKKIHAGPSLEEKEHAEKYAIGIREGTSTDPGMQNVGTKLPNYLGLYDVSGNVWEWCFDKPYGNPRNYDSVTKYDSDYTVDGVVLDPQGAHVGEGRIYKGGAHNIYLYYASLGNRSNTHSSHQTSSSSNVGLRLVFTPHK